MRHEPTSCDVLIKLLGAPHRDDLIGSALRLAHALLGRGARVQVWACGDATRLTSAALGDEKPIDVTDHTTRHPSTAAVVRDLLAAHPDRLRWYVCRFCCRDRAAPEQIPQVVVRSPGAFWRHVEVSGKVLAVGAV
ncbi:hypothetical protein ACWEKT_24705 [Nocardia takedensis]